MASFGSTTVSQGISVSRCLTNATPVFRGVSARRIDTRSAETCASTSVQIIR